MTNSFCCHKCFNIRQVIVDEREMPSKKLVFPMAFFCHRKSFVANSNLFCSATCQLSRDNCKYWLTLWELVHILFMYNLYGQIKRFSDLLYWFLIIWDSYPNKLVRLCVYIYIYIYILKGYIRSTEFWCLSSQRISPPYARIYHIDHPHLKVLINM